MITRRPRNWFVHCALMIGLITFGGPAMSLEQPEYAVVHKEGDIEYRRYAPYLVSETTVRADNYKAAGNEGFRRLFRYISGGNEGRAKIAMTAPVEQTPRSEKIAMTVPVAQTQSNTGDGWSITFMLPSAYTLETAPQPTDRRVAIREVPGRLMAVLRYSGRWTQSNYDEKRAELSEVISSESVTPIGEFQSAMYSAPYVPPFLRRNEVMVEVDRLPASVMATLRQAAVAY